MKTRFPLRSLSVALALLAPASLSAADNLTVGAQTYTTTQTVQADNTITTSGSVVVGSTANITFQAGAGISLGTGFKVNSGGLFRISAGQVFPYLVGFETAEGFSAGSLGGQRGWNLLAGSAQVEAASAFSGSLGLTLGAGSTVTQGFAVNSASVVFIDLYALPVATATAGDSSIVATETAPIGFQLINGEGQVFAFDGFGANQWLPTGVRFAVNSSNQATAWMRLTIRADYTARKWDLYVNGTLVEYDLAFTSLTETALRLLALRGSSSAAAGFDAIKVQTTNPLFTDADNDGIPDAWEVAFGLNPAVNDRNSDPDGDGRTNIEEYFRGTYPTAGPYVDTDGDGVPDMIELQLGTSSTTANASDSGNASQINIHRPTL